MSRGRYFPNPFLASPGSAPRLSADRAWEQASVLLPQLEECVQSGRVRVSTGRRKPKYEVYTGLGGIGVTLLRVGLFCRDARGDAAAAARFFERARKVAEACLAADPQSDEVSFFCGSPGYLALACVSAALLGDSKAASTHLRRLLEYAPMACRHTEDELLFGRAGYLYALLWTRQYCGPSAADFDAPLRETAERLVATGQVRADRAYRDWPLMWHCFDEPYIGAAHGVVGILAMLFQCYPLLSPKSKQLVSRTLDRLLAARFKSGNLPIILGERRDEHVHWCHGAPGLPGLVAAAEAALGGAAGGALREAALRAGDVVWERGAVLKGHGLCHGLAGNGYAFLSLYRLTGDEAQLQRAWAFAALLGNVEYQDAIRRQPDPQRSVPGVPDSPCSLMEGSAGVVCFLLDAASPRGSAFPAWELEGRGTAQA